AINSTKDEVGLCWGTSLAVGACDFDTPDAVWSRGRVARDGAVGKGERALIVDAPDAVWSRGRVTRDGAVGEGQRMPQAIEDASSGGGRGVTRDGTVAEAERVAIGDAAAVAVSC